MRRVPHPSPAMVVALLALFVALGGTGYAVLSGGVPDKQGVFHGCANKKTGALRLTKSARACKRKKELAVRWSQRGPAGAPGTPGTNGTPGANGTTVSARLRGTAPLTTTSSVQSFAISPSSWSQAADEVDQLVGLVTYHAPASSDCTAGGIGTFPGLTISIKVDGTSVGGLFFAPPDGADHTVSLSLTSQFEPTTAGTRTVTVEVNDNCGANGGVANAHFTVNAVKVDVLAAH